jgi:hypothetical protein
MKNRIKLFLGSVLALYLVCAGFAAISVSADNQADTQVTVQAEPAADANIVGDALEAQPKWMQLAVNIIAFAAVIASAVPKTSEKANIVLKGLRWLIDVGALNIFNAKNEKRSESKDRFLN